MSLSQVLSSAQLLLPPSSLPLSPAQPLIAIFLTTVIIIGIITYYHLPGTVLEMVLFLHYFNRCLFSYEVGPLCALVPLLVMLLPALFWLTLADPSLREHFQQHLPQEDTPLHPAAQAL